MEYLEKINQHLGTDCPPFNLDGQIHRFGKNKVNWAIGYSFKIKTDDHWVVICGDWRNPGLTVRLYSYEPETLTKSALKVARSKVEQLDRVIEEEKKIKHAICAKNSKDKFAAGISASHKYVTRKNIELFSARIDPNTGNLMIPVTKYKSIVGIQYISQFGDKWFEPGVELRGSYCALKSTEGAKVIYLAEGFATAASIQMATDHPVVCCFTANNVVNVAKSLRRPGGPFLVLCADRDKINPQTGTRAGVEVASKIKLVASKSLVVWPWDDQEKIGDFNDLHCESGLDAVKSRIQIDYNSELQKFLHFERDSGFTVILDEIPIRQPLRLLDFVAEAHPFKWCPELKTFYIFNGKIYEPYHENTMKEIAQRYYNNPRLVKEGQAAEFSNLAKRCDTITGKEAFSTDQDCIVFQNGVWDYHLEEFVPHSKERFATRLIPHNFDPEATCPTYDQLLENILEDPDMIDQANEFLGWCLSGLEYKTIQKFMVFSGEGKNGKSTLINVWNKTLGDDNCSFAMIGDVSKDKFLAFQFQNKLVNFSEEERVSVFNDTSTLKRMTGGTMMTFEGKNRDAVSAQNIAKIIISYNKIPKLSDTSQGMRRRMMILPFQFNLDKNPERKIENIYSKLDAEYSGIINRGLEGLARLYQRGDFQRLEASETAFDEMASESNELIGYVREFVTEDKDGILISDDIFEKLKKSVTNYEEKDKPAVMRNFNDALKFHGLKFHKKQVRRGESVKKGYFGLRIKMF
jgi:P4 family phage/plasmid primase-like protien